MSVINNRYDFVMLFDVENGNPNGNPDADNMPRFDPATRLGLVTAECLKRKIRNYVANVKDGAKGFDILIQNDKPLNTKIAEAAVAVGLEMDSKEKKGRSFADEGLAKARVKMCNDYYDVRTFGAVLNTGDVKCGTIRGAVQITNARSIDPIDPQLISLTRQALTSEAEFETNSVGNTFGKKYIVPYGLYRAEGFISANLANKLVGFTEEDLELLWQAIINMFEDDHSAARGKMVLRKLIVFKHEHKLGNAVAQDLFDKVTVTKREDVKVPRSYSDYVVTLDETTPNGVQLIVKR